MEKLTRGQVEVLLKLEKGPALVGRWAFSGGHAMRVPNKLLSLKLIEKGAHPTVKDRMGYGADAFYITDAGRKALTGRND